MSTNEVCTDCLPDSAPAQSIAPAVPLASTSSTTLDPLLDSSTFSPPPLDRGELPRLSIEFCDRCRWLHRAVWTQTELFLTFPPSSSTSSDGVTTSSGLKAITLLPRSSPETGGRFRVWLYRERTIEEEYAQNCPDSWGEAELVWDRKIEGAFPELKVLKQRIKALIAPQQDLGHSGKNAFGAGEAIKKEVGGAGDSRAPEVDDYTPRFKC